MNPQLPNCDQKFKRKPISGSEDEGEGGNFQPQLGHDPHVE